MPRSNNIKRISPPRSGRQPGKLVKFTSKNDEIKTGRTYNSEPLHNGKTIVHLLTSDFKPVLDENGEQKKVLIHHERLSLIGFCD